MSAVAAPVIRPLATARDHAACVALLPRVSRTFAISIRLLPTRLRYPVTVAYLVCRVADTIEDAATVAPDVRATLLERLAATLSDGETETPWMAPLLTELSGAERDLMLDCGAVLRELNGLAPAQRQSIVNWAVEMCVGMAKHAVVGFGDDGLQRLHTEAELREYCYFVAGTVGHMLTELFSADDPAAWGDRSSLSALGEQFGIALQLTNIIKDAADDSARGRAFVPRAFEPGATGHVPSATAIRTTAFLADNLLRQGLNYCLRIPRNEPRIRAFCLSALCLAVRTVEVCKARGEDSTARAKLRRADVRRILLAVVLVSPSRRLSRMYFDHLASRSAR